MLQYQLYTFNDELLVWPVSGAPRAGVISRKDLGDYNILPRIR